MAHVHCNEQEYKAREATVALQTVSIFSNPKKPHPKQNPKQLNALGIPSTARHAPHFACIPSIIDIKHTLILLTSTYQASTETPLGLEASALRFLTAPGLLRVYLAKARASAFLQDTFWLPTKLSTATAMARSMSFALQYSDSLILAKASEIRRMDSR
jgi:hypothetical protein